MRDANFDYLFKNMSQPCWSPEVALKRARTADPSLTLMEAPVRRQWRNLFHFAGNLAEGKEELRRGCDHWQFLHLESSDATLAADLAATFQGFKTGVYPELLIFPS